MQKLISKLTKYSIVLGISTMLFFALFTVYLIIIKNVNAKFFVFLFIIQCVCLYMLFWNNEARIYKYFNFKKIFDIFILVILHFSISFLHIYVKNTVFLDVYLVLVTIGLLFLYVSKFTVFGIDAKNNKETIFIVIFEVSAIIIFFSILNQYIFYFDNTSFIVQNSKWYVISFDFIYYTFCTSLTYGEAGITPVSILAKLLQMINIIVFYCFIGYLFLNTVTNVIDRKSK